MGCDDMEVGTSIKKFNYNFEINKTVSNDRLIIYGVASTQKKDRDDERMSISSLEKAFDRYMRKNPVLFYNHRSGADAIGR